MDFSSSTVQLHFTINHYKKDVHFTDDMERELIECAEASAALDLRMDNLRKRAQVRMSKRDADI